MDSSDSILFSLVQTYKVWNLAIFNIYNLKTKKKSNFSFILLFYNFHKIYVTQNTRISCYIVEPDD